MPASSSLSTAVPLRTQWSCDYYLRLGKENPLGKEKANKTT